MKKILPILIVMCLVFSSCGRLINNPEDEKTAYEKVHDMLINLQSFRSEATVRFISNKNENEYTTLQHGRINGIYRIEIVSDDMANGSVTIFDGENILQFNPRIGGQVLVSHTENQERSEILLTSFIRNYFTSKEVTVSVSNLGESRCTVLETLIPGNHPYLYSQKLWIDNETLAPVQLVIYDEQGSERIVVTYKSFEYNIDLEDSLFTVS